MSIPEKIVVSYNASDMRTTEANILSQIDTEIHPKNEILTWIFSQSIFTLSRHRNFKTIQPDKRGLGLSLLIFNASKRSVAILWAVVKSNILRTNGDHHYNLFESEKRSLLIWREKLSRKTKMLYQVDLTWELLWNL